MMLARRRPGEPLVALALILTGWVGLRAFAWEAARHDAAPQLAVPAPDSAVAMLPPRRPAAPPARWAAAPGLSAARPLLPLRSPAPSVEVAPLVLAPASGPESGAASGPASAAGGAPQVAPPAPAPFTAPLPPRNRIAVAGGHQMLWLAATALLPFPPMGLRTAPPAARAPTATPSRWSGDGWLLIRRGDGTIAPGPLVGTYGASQAGAVLRYRLVADDPHRLAAYLRGTAALNGTREQQVALGLTARPLPRLPVAAMAELRVQRDGVGEHVRPALALVTELPPQRLPLGFTGELYVQGGYVGGSYASAFVDGLARAERPLASVGAFRLRAGGGAWGARQRGAARLDVGPTASVTVRLADTASARLAADWRFRIAGDARPGSGPALTVSAGF